jgi:hypothetical protein
MNDPKSLIEHNERSKANYKLTGYGLDTTIHQPCYFCAAPDFKVYKIIEANERLAEDAICLSCGRSAKGIITRDETTVYMELVQTGGPDQPACLPQIRRIAELGVGQ